MSFEMKKLLQIAQKEKFAIPAVNFIDWLTAKTYLAVSERLNLPLILAYAQSHETLLSLEEAACIGNYIKNKAKIPVILHLDHGQNVEFIKRAIALGFNSVMIDASLESYENNVQLTKEVVKYAHPLGISVEAEIGYVGANENKEQHVVSESRYTTVEEAINFVNDTQVDSLAVSIGTAHGTYKGTPTINFERLHELSQHINIPLVLHGGSSSGKDNLSRCAKEGISKINIFTDMINAAYHATLYTSTTNYLELKEVMENGVIEMLTYYYNIFGTQSIGEEEYA